MKQLNELLRSFKSVGLMPTLGDDWINIARPDGIHCEFYSCGDFYAVTATYAVNGKERDIDFYLPQDNDLFVETVCKILNHKQEKKSG